MILAFFDRNTDEPQQGASPREQLLEACRRDNTELFESALEAIKSQTKEQIADFLNNIKDSMGNYLLHICAQYGSCEYPQFLRCDLADSFSRPPRG